MVNLQAKLLSEEQLLKKNMLLEQEIGIALHSKSAKRNGKTMMET